MPLHEVAEVRTGIAKGKTNLKDPVELPYLRVANVQDGHLNLKTVKTILVERSQIERYSLREGDILMTEGGDFDKLGRGDVWRGQIRVCLHQNHVFAVRPNPNQIDPAFLAALAASQHGRNYFLGCAKRSTNLASINSSQLKSFPVLIPPLAEQRKISQIIAAWDNAIATTKLLIQNHLQQRQALTSQLLTGKRRIPMHASSQARQATPHGAIPADWTYPQIQSIASEVTQKHNSRNDYPVLSCTKHAGLVDSLSFFNKQVFSKNLDTYKVVPRGCFVYATNHIDEGSIGYQERYDFGLVSPMYTVFRTNGTVNNHYLFRLLKTEHFRQIFAAATNASVDRRGSLRWVDFKKLHVPLPRLEEQNAIVALLHTADLEIDLLQRKLHALQVERTAISEKLLSGARRVTLTVSHEEAIA